MSALAAGVALRLSFLDLAPEALLLLPPALEDGDQLIVRLEGRRGLFPAGLDLILWCLFLWLFLHEYLQPQCSAVPAMMRSAAAATSDIDSLRRIPFL